MWLEMRRLSHLRKASTISLFTDNCNQSVVFKYNVAHSTAMDMNNVCGFLECLTFNSSQMTAACLVNPLLRVLLI